MGDPIPGIFANSQCVGTLCVQATPNLSCEYLPGGCQTIVAGFRAEDFEKLKQCGDGDTKPLPIFSVMPGACLRYMPATWVKKGVNIGDTLTHINHEYIGGNLERLAEVSSNLKKGDILTFWRNNQRIDITL